MKRFLKFQTLIALWVAVAVAGSGCVTLFDDSKDAAKDKKDEKTVKDDKDKKDEKTVKDDKDKKDEKAKDDSKDKKKDDKDNRNIKDLGAQNPEELRKTAEKMVDNILAGMKDRDYKKFSQDFTDEMKANITPDVFTKMMDQFDKEMGKYQSKVYLGEMNKGYFRVYLWKGKFKKPELKHPDKNPFAEKIDDDTLIRLVMGNVDDKYMVFGFWFQ
jgi:hypothetical protein